MKDVPLLVALSMEDISIRLEELLMIIQFLMSLKFMIKLKEYGVS